jgi:hypothetical protein
MIISASYKTDIPAFYGQWFINRLNAGWCATTNPHNRRAYRVMLDAERVEAFVFWTKNIGPFRRALSLVADRHYPFVVQYTINGYPPELESSVVNAERSAEHMRMIAAEYGPRVGVWRYDTILFTSLITIDYHRRNFERLANLLEGSTDEVVVSFIQIYHHTKANLRRAAKESGLQWADPDNEVKYRLASELAQVARARGMQLSMCSQRQFLAAGVQDARCVDIIRLSDVAGRAISAKQAGNRLDCGCFASKDIGEYDTCPHGCVYCYAVTNNQLARANHRQHDPNSEFLLRPQWMVDSQDLEPITGGDSGQMRLFE